MDEWITSERIVSPPSVGNAKARDLKRKREEEEREKVRRERIVEGKKCRSLMTAARKKLVDMDDEVISWDESAEERRKLRRSAPRHVASSNVDEGIVDAANLLQDEDNETRLTRRQRLKTTNGEVIAQETSTDNLQSEEIAMDVVTTLSAPELDEHKGMDNAALKEHEEVTEVKNVATLDCTLRTSRQE